MPYSIGDGVVTLAVAVGFVGYVYVKHLGRAKRLEIIHQERLVAMEKGIPLPEFPLEAEERPRANDPTNVIPILGIVLFSLSAGTMILLYHALDAAEHGLWVAPLPFAFLGLGLLVFHALKTYAYR